MFVPLIISVYFSVKYNINFPPSASSTTLSLSSLYRPPQFPPRHLLPLPALPQLPLKLLVFVDVSEPCSIVPTRVELPCFLQNLLLKSKLFGLLEMIMCNQNCLKRIREHVGFAIAALIWFNKDVFVGQMLMGATIRALMKMASANSLKVLCSLVKSIKSPLVDEIESNGQIPKIINFLNHEDLQVKVVAMDCILEIGYFGRKEAIDAMINEGLIKKLVELQRSELGGDLIDLGRFEESEIETESVTNAGKSKSRRFLESHPFASCVARFAVQLEVGEGLRQREKRAFKQDILVRVREASVNDADAATIVAEVLWGSSP